MSDIDPYTAWWRKEPNAPLPLALTFADWRAWGGRIVGTGRKVGWKLAFWLAYGETRWNDTYAQIAEELQVDRNYLYRAASIARHFADVDLSPYVSLSHGRYLANDALTDDERKTLYDQVVHAKMTTEQTRLLVSKYLEAKSLPDGSTSLPSDKPKKITLPAAEVEVLREKAAERDELLGEVNTLATMVAQLQQGLAEHADTEGTHLAAAIVEPESRGPNIDLNALLDEQAQCIADLKAELTGMQATAPFRVSDETLRQMRELAGATSWGGDVVGWHKDLIGELFGDYGK